MAVNESTMAINAPTPEIAAALHKAFAVIEHVPKSEKNKQQGYAYAGEVAIIKAIRQPLIDAGLIPIPSYDVIQDWERTTSKGTTLGFVRVRCDVGLLHIGGSYWQNASNGFGEGMDAGDKATVKAQTVAYRDALTHLLMLARGDADSEQDSPQRPARQSLQQPAAKPPASKSVPGYQDVWPLNQHADLTVSAHKVNGERNGHPVHWFQCTYDGVTAWAYYQPTTDKGREALDRNADITKAIKAQVHGGEQYPRLTKLTFTDEVNDCPPINGADDPPLTVDEAVEAMGKGAAKND